VAVSVILCISHNYIWQDTLTFHENAVRLLPQNARARIGYGFALLRINKAEEASAQFEAGLKIKPNSAPLLAGLANTFMRMDGRCDRVRPLLAQALATEPGHWQSLWVLGDCFVMEGKIEQAEQIYHLAIQNSSFPDAKLLASWGRLLETQGKTSAAIAAYERAAVIDPTDEGIRMRLKQLVLAN
jgi:cytochrome c-type biogenesis protein CcmH/NrfG